MSYLPPGMILISLMMGDQLRGPKAKAKGDMESSAWKTLRWPSTMAPPKVGSK